MKNCSVEHPSHGACPSRRGSALVIVLGLLAVLMLMAVAFAIAMRTERGGASNMRHAIVARQMLDTALARVMADLDEELAGVPAPDWMVYVSTNRHQALAGSDPQRAGVLSYEVAQHLPPDHRIAAQRAFPEWLAITGGIGTTTNFTDDVILGRYAYVVLNNAGLLDANHVGSDATNRIHGLSAEEIRLWDPTRNEGISEFAGMEDAQEFARRRREEHGYYDSMGELVRLTEKGRVPGGTLSRKYYRSMSDNTFSTNNFGVTSLALETFGPHQEGSITGDNPYGVRPRKFHIAPGSLDNYSPAMGDRLIEAFERAFADSVAAEAGIRSPTQIYAPSERTAVGDSGIRDGIPYAHVAAVALLDYLDDDFLPGRGPGGVEYLRQQTGIPWSHRPCTEPVPMFNAFFLYQPDNKWTETPIHANPEDPTSAIVEYRVELPLVFEAETTFLNREIPEALRNQRFNVVFGGGLADIKGDFDDKATMLGNMFAAFGQQMISGEYVHTPRINARRSDPGAGAVPFTVTFTYPADEHPLPDEFQVVYSIGGTVLHGSNEIQHVPGSDRMPPLILEAEFRRDDLRDSSHEHDMLGWAYVADPRFAYATGEERLVWMTSQTARALVEATETVNAEIRAWAARFLSYDRGTHQTLADGTPIQFTNPYMKFLITTDNDRVFRDPGGGVTLLTEWPDGLWSDAVSQDRAEQAVLHYVANRYPWSVGELGHLVLSPLRTISLFDNLHPADRGRLIPRHRVLDGFTVHGARTITDQAGMPYRAAWLEGRVNLNAPFTARWEGAGSNIRLAFDGFNVDPLTAVFAGLPLNEFAPTIANRKHLDWDAARRLSEALVFDILDQTRDQVPNPADYNLNGLAFDLSVLGRRARETTNTWTHILQSLGNLGPRSEFEREAVIRNSVELLTTRQQVFTIVLKADAFTPEFGFDDAGHGTTLATAHAIIEVWRDPEPVRDANGIPIWVTDSDGNLLRRSGRLMPQHNWFVRYMRQF